MMNAIQWWVGCLVVVTLCALLTLLPPVAAATSSSYYRGGGELASLTVPLFTSLTNHTHRQTFCHRYDMFRAGEIELRGALSGMALQPLMALGDFFNYDHEAGIHPTDPGLLVDLMDALAERANFTWRNSFAVMEEPEVLNQTWTNMLLWGIENYDVAVNWWDQSVERMEKGAAYIEPWFDGSLILIDQEDPPEDVNTIVWFNWTSPFESAVWALILITILLSALVYQFIEYMSDEQQDRSLGQWFSDNLYLSSLNFTQNFEYAPSSVAGRIFGVSMGMWALVMTATYTANLASLFVQEQRPPLVVDSIDQAILLEIPICTMGLTNSDSMIQERYKDAKRRPKATELEAYQALRRGECGLVAAYKDNWLGYKGNSEYNPACDLEWVGRVVATIKSGFAVKADAGHLCSSLIRDVLNLHMTELISEGVLQTAWEKHRAKTKDQDCEVQDSDSRRRRLGGGAVASGYQSSRQRTNNRYHRRKLKAATKSAAAAGAAAASGAPSTGSGQSSLTLQQMMGTFALHWASMAIAILVTFLSKYYENYNPSREKPERRTYRHHGPIIGQPPKVNTSVQKQRKASTSLVVRNIAAGPGPLERSTSSIKNSTDNATAAAEKDNYNDTNNQTNGGGHQRADTTVGTINDEDGNDFLCGLNVSQYDWSPRLRIGGGSNSNDINNKEQLETQRRNQSHGHGGSEPPAEWQRSHAELQQKQRELSIQMSSMMIMIQEMRKEQQQLLLVQQQQLLLHQQQRSDPNGSNQQPNESSTD